MPGNNIFFSVPIGFLFANEHLLGQYPVNPELFLDGDALEALDDGQVARVRNLLDAHGLRRRVHGPISDMALGAFDPGVREVSRRRHLQAIDFAAAIGAGTVVVHSGFDNQSKRGLEARYLKGLVPSLRSLCEKASQNGIRLVLENTFEPAPDLLLDAVAGAGAENLGICFDVAHQRVFGDVPLGEWFDRCASLVEEVHITDNAGQWDDHLAPGRGDTDFGEVFGAIERHGLKPVFTFEPHSIEAFLETLKFIEANARHFA